MSKSFGGGDEEHGERTYIVYLRARGVLGIGRIDFEFSTDNLPIWRVRMGKT